MKQKAQELLERAKAAAETVETWADLSNALFDPEVGLVAKAYPMRAEREKFMRSAEYRAIRRLINEMQERTGFIEGASPKKKSGKFIVRLPATLHAALEAEAKEEGVSLNQLVVTKLAIRLSKAMG
jgi:predicted HicB family RNase H-like nuclease